MTLPEEHVEELEALRERYRERKIHWILFYLGLQDLGLTGEEINKELERFCG